MIFHDKSIWRLKFIKIHNNQVYNIIMNLWLSCIYYSDIPQIIRICSHVNALKNSQNELEWLSVDTMEVILQAVTANNFWRTSTSSLYNFVHYAFCHLFEYRLNPFRFFENNISIFESSYHDLEISVTPKVYILFSHVPQFFKMYGSLSLFSEQADESVHSVFKMFWCKRKINSMSNPNFLKPFSIPLSLTVHKKFVDDRSSFKQIIHHVFLKREKCIGKV